jgi:hypothetical protein
MIPKLNEDNTQIIWKPRDKNNCLIAEYKKGNIDNMLCFVNKSPEYNTGKS